MVISALTGSPAWMTSRPSVRCTRMPRAAPSASAIAPSPSEEGDPDGTEARRPESEGRDDREDPEQCHAHPSAVEGESPDEPGVLARAARPVTRTVARPETPDHVTRTRVSEPSRGPPRRSAAGDAPEAGVGSEDEAVREDDLRDPLDVLGDDVAHPLDEGRRLRDPQEVSPARGLAPRRAPVGPGGRDDLAT